jgi:hypothetical protein
VRYDILVLYLDNIFNPKIEAMVRKTGLGSLLLLGAAAFGAYKYSKMSDQQKKDLMDKGKKIVNNGVSSIKNRFGGQNAPEGSMGSNI